MAVARALVASNCEFGSFSIPVPSAGQGKSMSAFLTQFTFLAIDFVEDPLMKGCLLDTVSPPDHAGVEVVRGETPSLLTCFVKWFVVNLVTAACGV